MSTPDSDWTIPLSRELTRHANDPEYDGFRELRDEPRRPGLDAHVALVMPTETPAAGLLDSVTLIDRAFRWATRAIERQEPVREMLRDRARPIAPNDGLIVREVDGERSAGLFFELSLRIYEALTSEPAAFIYALITTLELLGIHVRVRVYRDRDPAPHQTVIEHDFEPREPASAIIVNYSPTIVVHIHETHVEVETDEDEAHAIESREQVRVERELEGRPVGRRRSSRRGDGEHSD